MTTLIYVLGDQLTPGIAALRGCDPASTIVLMTELAAETTYVRHHKKKLVLILSAMRHFAAELRAAGWTVDYVELDAPGNAGTFTGELKRALKRHLPGGVRVTEPGEYRVREEIAGWSGLVPTMVSADDRFICSQAEFAEWAEHVRGRLTMEFFYREMRRRTATLMDGSTPAGGKWNFDKMNRRPAARDLLMPRPPSFAPDAVTRDVMALVERRFPHNMGAVDGFGYAVTAADAERAAAYFLAEALPRFGDFQDAMLAGEPFLYHALLSPYINLGLLDPLDLCRRAEIEYRTGAAPINAVEGFVRQILGWREYVRGIYWSEMPAYIDRNALGAHRDLPAFYWSGETRMACIRAAVGQTIEHAYAHHIQRLMITGNFAMLIGADPRQVHEWYLEVYADAYEWVELPNTLGMSQFADGGLLGTKPYAASGAYIDRMSDYCEGCQYDVKRRTGEGACPFNALYWDFLARNRAILASNRRLAMPYATWDKMSDEVRGAYRSSAAAFLQALNGPESV